MTCSRVDDDTPPRLRPKVAGAAYLSHVGTTGLIFGAIVAAWLAYLVPLYLRRDSAGHGDPLDPAARFSDNVRIVRNGGSGGASDALRVTTPHTRRAMLDSMRRAERHAAGRRRNVIIVLVVALAATITLAAVGLTVWWPVAIPGVLLVAFLAISRVTVQVMHREFDRRLAALEGSDVEETVLVQQASKTDRAKTEGLVESVELGMPVGKPGSLWDPLPITRPNYVSAPPVGGRTVRTIDLSAPEPVPGDNKPVVADAPEISLVSAMPAEERLRAVGE